MVTIVDVNRPERQANAGAPARNQLVANAVAGTSNSKAPITKTAAQAVVNYLNTALSTYLTSYNIRSQLIMRDLAYYRENDATRQQSLAKGYNMTGDPTKLQNITVPIVMPQVESALAYHTGVFLTGYPIFGVVAPPEAAEAMTQMETLIGENSIRGAWPQQLMKTLRNGLKYDLGAVEVVWEKRKSARIGTPQIDKLTTGTVTDTYYEGNFLKDIDPYNLIIDTRVSPDVNHIEGEFAGYTELLSRIATKQRMDNLDPFSTMNFRQALESPSTGSQVDSQTAGYFIPTVNPDALLPAANQQPFNWDNWFVGNKQTRADGSAPIQYQNAYEWTTLYARILPSDFDIKTTNPNHVQIWKFIIINRSVCIFAQRQDNAHGYLPIIVCKPSNDGMSWQSKSFAQNVEPYQYLASALMNSGLESQRRKVYDRILYDANRIRKQDIDNVSPVARIPVKNNQYAKDLQSAVHIMPYRDEGVATVMEFAQNVTSMADIANGQNRVQQGQFQKGNKTRREFDTVMTNSNSRQQMAAIGLEYSFFTPIKEIIKSNILQYQPPTELVNTMTKQVVAIDPTKLRQQIVSFKLSDGLLPTDKLVATDVLITILQTAQAVPEIRAKYDIMGMMLYFWQLQGAHWLKDFERSPEEQAQYLTTMQQAALASGNATPEKQQTPPADAGALGAS